MKKLLFILLVSLFTYTSCATRVITTTATPTKNIVIVKKAPYQHKVVYVNGKKYYHWNGRYHRKTRKGFVLVNI
jgi:uncharacterized lipoprotein YajG